MPMPRRCLLGLLAPLVLATCTGRDASPRATPGAAAGPAGGPPSPSPTVSGVGVVAEVNGAPVFAAELDQRAESRLARLRQEEYDIRKQVLDEIVAERLIEAEAKKRGISRQALVEREVAARSQAPSPATILSLYEQNKARFTGTSKEQALERIRKALVERAQSQRRTEFLQGLREKARIAVRLTPPRAAVAIPDGAPATGPASLPVSIVEFTDYQCPYCHRAQATMEQVLSYYQGKVRLVHMDFPLDGHPGAFPAARAARCAGEQGKFWEFHKNLMTDSGLLDKADLEARAGKLGLKVPEFGACVASGRYDAAIRASFDEGEALGVTGTPAYFVNGRMLSGARPFEAFSELIESELAGH